MATSTSSEESKKYYEDSQAKIDEYYKNLTSERDKYYTDKQAANDEYYKLLKEKSYKDLFNDKLQLSNANQNAMKYASNTLKANGFGTQGVTETAKASQNNAYINALEKAQGNYNTNVQTINTNEANAKTSLEDVKRQDYLNALGNQHSEQSSLDSTKHNETLDQIKTDESNAESKSTELLGQWINYLTGSYFSSTDDINSWLKDQGVIFDTEGNPDWAKSKEVLIQKGFTDDTINQVISAYGIGMKTIGGSTTNNDGIVFNPSNFNYYNKDGKAMTNTNLDNVWKDEFAAVTAKVIDGTYKEGTVLKMVNGYGDYMYLLVGATDTNGNPVYYYTNKGVYDNPKTKTKDEVNPNGYTAESSSDTKTQYDNAFAELPSNTTEAKKVIAQIKKEYPNAPAEGTICRVSMNAGIVNVKVSYIYKNGKWSQKK